jgi:lipopolysaccharide export system protein LptC
LSGTKIVMESPRVNGFTSDSRPYELTARAAAQDLTKPDILELKDITAVVELKDGQHVTIKSINGIYDTKSEMLKLSDHITLNSTSGYEGRLSEATVNVTSGNVVSESPVDLKLPNGFLNANRMEVVENGALVVFGGGVAVTLNPAQARPAPQASAPVRAPAQAWGSLSP